MYNKSELKTIVENCNTIDELQIICNVFSYLIKNRDLKKSNFLNVITQMRFRKLTRL